LVRGYALAKTDFGDDNLGKRHFLFFLPAGSLPCYSKTYIEDFFSGIVIVATMHCTGKN